MLVMQESEFQTQTNKMICRRLLHDSCFKRNILFREIRFVSSKENIDKVCLEGDYKCTENSQRPRLAVILS